ncbi:TIGR00269 family protein [Candidatus Nitrososphaera sp. FF02]|uniref:TIGR00269 family protein n=1 Tax=Candidatus Nitrososphaera sp. FF02 TaxID=3398226 RepID=UPI0039E88A5B
MHVCTKCDKEDSVYFRAYSGEYLCKKCFVRSIEDKAARTMSKYSMLKYGERVAVGVSGGKDSLSLLYVMKKIFDDHDRSKDDLIAVTIDEGIKGYRDESLQIVKDFCGRLGVQSKVMGYKDLFGVSMDEAMVLRPSEKMSSCSMCGTFRRRAIDLAAESVGADIVATAHNMDDQLQTFMINLLAGDVERIGWIYPEPVEYMGGMKKIKPFVELYEHEIVFYALQREIPFQSEECPYMNESIRTDLREFFNKMETEHPGIKNNAFASMMKVSEKLRATSAGPRGEKKCSICGRDSTGDVCSVCKTVGALRPASQM